MNNDKEGEKSKKKKVENLRGQQFKTLQEGSFHNIQRIIITLERRNSHFRLIFASEKKSLRK